MLTLPVAFVTSCGAGPSAPSPAVERARPTEPGRVLFPVAERSAALARFPAALRDAWCPPHADDTPLVVKGLSTAAGDADTASEPFAMAVMSDAAAGVAGDAAATASLVRLLDRWARADALWGGDRRAMNRNYALDRTLLPTIVAFATIRERQELPAAARARIEAWLARLVASRLSPPADSVTRRNNHRYLRGSVDIAWGALVQDERRFQAGIAAYRDALAAMRPDGSFPLETARGARALWYQRHSIASLVVIAEIGAQQGLDLYGLQDGGRDLHGAIRFLLDAVDQPELVLPYAAANTNSGTELAADDQDLGFLEERGHDRHYMAWVEIYAARFPNRPEAMRLMALLGRTDRGFRPMLDDYSGGATTCFFAQLPP
jgi:poly(beta-D-mannuronate) lyase